jgi:hypothetical protein
MNTHVRFAGAMHPANAIEFPQHGRAPAQPVPTAPRWWQKLRRWWLDGVR